MDTGTTNNVNVGLARLIWRSIGRIPVFLLLAILAKALLGQSMAFWLGWAGIALAIPFVEWFLQSFQKEIRWSIAFVGFFLLWFLIGYLLHVPPIRGLNAFVAGRGSERIFWSEQIDRDLLVTLIIIVYSAAISAMWAMKKTLGRMAGWSTVALIAVGVLFPGQITQAQQLGRAASAEESQHNQPCTENWSRPDINLDHEMAKDRFIPASLVSADCQSVIITLPKSWADGWSWQAIDPDPDWMIYVQPLDMNNRALHESRSFGPKDTPCLNLHTFSFRLRGHIGKGGLQLFHAVAAGCEGIAPPPPTGLTSSREKVPAPDVIPPLIAPVRTHQQ